MSTSGIGEITFNFPIVAAALDAVVNPHFAGQMGKHRRPRGDEP